MRTKIRIDRKSGLRPSIQTCFACHCGPHHILYPKHSKFKKETYARAPFWGSSNSVALPMTVDVRIDQTVLARRSEVSASMVCSMVCCTEARGPMRVRVEEELLCTYSGPPECQVCQNDLSEGPGVHLLQPFYISGILKILTPVSCGGRRTMRRTLHFRDQRISVGFPTFKAWRPAVYLIFLCLFQRTAPAFLSTPSLLASARLLYLSSNAWSSWSSKLGVLYPAQCSVSSKNTTHINCKSFHACLLVLTYSISHDIISSSMLHLDLSLS